MRKFEEEIALKSTSSNCSTPRKKKTINFHNYWWEYDLLLGTVHLKSDLRKLVDLYLPCKKNLLENYRTGTGSFYAWTVSEN